MISDNGKTRQELAPGDFALIPAWTEHQEVNEGDEEVTVRLRSFFTLSVIPYFLSLLMTPFQIAPTEENYPNIFATEGALTHRSSVDHNKKWRRTCSCEFGRLGWQYKKIAINVVPQSRPSSKHHCMADTRVMSKL